MDIRDYCRSTYIRERKVERLKDKVAYLRACAEGFGSITADSDKIIVTHTNDRMSHIVSEIVDLQKEIDRLSGKNEDARKATMQIISYIPNEQERTILTMVYIDRKNLRQASALMGVGYSNAKRIHGNAKKNFNNLTEFC